MNCAYHSVNAAVVNCNGCGKSLCPACDHRIKGFPYCQDCIVEGVEMLRSRGNTGTYIPFVRKKTSPFLAVVLSLICPGLGSAYNGQTSKAIVYFAVFIGLFQLAVLSGGMPLFVLGFFGMWLFAALDSWRSAQLIRSGLTPGGAEDIVVQRLMGNPKLWGGVLVVIGSMFFLQNVLPLRNLFRTVLPVVLIGLGLYLLRDYFTKRRQKALSDSVGAPYGSETGSNRSLPTTFRTGEFDDNYRGSRQKSSWR